MEKPNINSSAEDIQEFAKNTSQEERKNWAQEQKNLVLKEAEMLKGGGEYYVDDEGKWSFQFSDKQLEVMAEKARQSRIDRYFEEMGEEIQLAEDIGDVEEKDALKQKLASKDKGLVADAVYENGKWTITPKGKVVSEVKKVIAERKDFEKAKEEFTQDVELRKTEHKNASEIKWGPIDFESNLAEVMSTASLGDEETIAQQKKRKGATIILDVFTTVSDYRKKNPQGENGKILEVRDFEFGKTANNSRALNEEHLEGLQEMLGMKLDVKRIDAVHYTFSTDGKLNAVMITLEKDESVDAYKNTQKEHDKIYREYMDRNPGANGVPTYLFKDINEAKYQKEEKEKIAENPTLGRGSLIIKKDGKKMFLPNITYKQYPVASPNGRFISTFAGGPSRGIFDEEVFFASEHMDTSTGRKAFSIGENSDDYVWREGRIERRSGKTSCSGGWNNVVIPPAHVTYNEKSGALIYKLDADSDNKFNGFPMKVLEESEIE